MSKCCQCIFSSSFICIIYGNRGNLRNEYKLQTTVWQGRVLTSNFSFSCTAQSINSTNSIPEAFSVVSFVCGLVEIHWNWTNFVGWHQLSIETKPQQWTPCTSWTCRQCLLLKYAIKKAREWNTQLFHADADNLNLRKYEHKQT